jgi:erythromycin esterase
MKKASLILYLLLIGFIFHAQFETILKDFAVGFNDIKASEFSFLDEELDDVYIVGYGEDTHGTSEFTTLAQELFLYLNGRHHFRTLIIETGFGEGLFLNDYIHGRRDDLNDILSNHNSTWRYRTEEFEHLMNTLKEYNRRNPNKVSLFGCEMQYVISDVNRIQEYLKSLGIAYGISGFEKHLWQPMEESEKSDQYIAYIKLKNYLTDNYEMLVEKSSEEAFSLAYHHVEVIGQFVTTIQQNVVQRKYDLRDIYMAENIEWILNFQGEDSKALFWAHNAHIGDWVSNGIVDVAGHQLRKRFGDSYFNIATDFGIGEFIAFPVDADKVGWKLQTFEHTEVLEGTLSFALHQMGKPNAFLNLRKARSIDANRILLDKPLTHMSGAGANAISDVTTTNDIGVAFDAIIYLDKTSKINFVESK